MCACWPHWEVLPEHLRSDLLHAYGRCEISKYHRAVLEAVAIWRRLGIWNAVREGDLRIAPAS
jgi:hypothetical protein